jgi:hypothetical protein
MRRIGEGRGQQGAGRLGQIRRSIPRQTLQIEREPITTGRRFAARLQEGVANGDRHARGHVQAMIGSTRPQ